jgi:hypothetical protein
LRPLVDVIADRDNDGRAIGMRCDFRKTIAKQVVSAVYVRYDVGFAHRIKHWAKNFAI